MLYYFSVPTRRRRKESFLTMKMSYGAFLCGPITLIIHCLCVHSDLFCCLADACGMLYYFIGDYENNWLFDCRMPILHAFVAINVFPFNIVWKVMCRQWKQNGQLTHYTFSYNELTMIFLLLIDGVKCSDFAYDLILAKLCIHRISSFMKKCRI